MTLSRIRTAAPIVALGLGACAVAGTGTAYAYVHGAGSGSVTGTAGSGAAVTLQATATVGAGSLYPGASIPLNVTVADPSGSKNISITAVTASTITVAAAPTPKGTCGVTKVHWAPVANSPALPAAITAGGSAVVINGNFTMDTDVEDGCQGATFTLTLTVNGTY